MIDHEDLEEQDLVLLAEVPAFTEGETAKVRSKKVNISVGTVETDLPDNEFDLAYGRSDSAEELSLSEVPIIRMKEEDYYAALEKDLHEGEERNSQGIRKVRICVGLVCLLVFIGLIVGITVGIKSKGGGTTETTESAAGQNPPTSPSPAPTPVLSRAPSLAPSQAQSQGPSRTQSQAPSKALSQAPSPFVPAAFQIIADALSLTGSTFPTDELTPEYKAVDFLSEEYENSGEMLGFSRLRRRYALVNMFYAMGGPRWNSGLGFLTDQHECSWHYVSQNVMKGVICDQNMTKVTTISIPDNNLVGTIPDELGYISSMQRLDLSFNSIGGSIPTGLQTISDIERLSLNSNLLTGTVPSFLSNEWTSLKYLSIENNNLTGNISPLCDVAGIVMLSDCLGGDTAEVNCSCCVFCCSSDGKCGSS